MDLKHTASPEAYGKYVDSQIQVLLNKLYPPHFSHSVVNVADMRLYRATLKHVLETLDETACRLHSIIEWAEGEGLEEVTANQMEVFAKESFGG